MTGLNERQEELSSLDAQIRGIKAAPETIKLEVRRMEVEARARIEQLQAALEQNPKELTPSGIAEGGRSLASAFAGAQ